MIAILKHGRPLALLLSLLHLAGCTATIWQPRIIESSDFVNSDGIVGFVKCHMKAGDIYVFKAWHLSDDHQTLTGKGLHYGVDRKRSTPGEFTVELAEIALIETTHPGEFVSGPAAVMGVMTIASLIVTLSCIIDPKTCFGSCPTFYFEADSRGGILAEGFSSSIARPLEATDVDALTGVRRSGGDFGLVMTNEALETHRVRALNLLAVPVEEGESAYHATDRKFYLAGAGTSPASFDGPLKNGLELLSSLDGEEYFTLANERDLLAKEELCVTFPPMEGAVGLVISTRNTLLNTYLFYQGLAHLGWSAGEFFAQLEREPQSLKAELMPLHDLFGRIEVYARDSEGMWVRQGFAGETGPIAREVALVPLSGVTGGDSLRIKLVLSQGFWRIDHLTAVPLRREITPIRLSPVSVLYKGEPDDRALALLHDPNVFLDTYPGDTYRIGFDVPEREGDYEYFLEATGYYLEWMRESWLAETDLSKAGMILTDPRRAVQDMAAGFKAIEYRMEEDFWSSRFGRNER